MADALKTFFSPALVRLLARDIVRVHSAFPNAAFVKAAIRFDPPEDVVHELAYQYLTADSIQLAVATLRFNVGQHPESADAWRRLGAGLERSGLRPEALESYRKAVALAERQDLPNLETYRQHAARLATPR